MHPRTALLGSSLSCVARGSRSSSAALALSPCLPLLHLSPSILHTTISRSSRPPRSSPPTTMPAFRALVNRIRRTQLPQRLHLRRPRVNAETTLDGLYTTCKLLGAVADGVANVPALKGAASLTKEIVNIAQVRISSCYKISRDEIDI